MGCVAAVLSTPHVGGCKAPPPDYTFPTFTIEQTLELASVVVHARNTANHHPGHFNMDLTWDFNSDFEILRVFKPSELEVGESIAVTLGSVRHTCQGTPEFTVGMSYILALNKDTADQSNYTLAEPGTKATAAFDPTAENLQAAEDVVSGKPEPEPECPPGRPDCVIETGSALGLCPGALWMICLLMWMIIDVV